MGIKNRKLNLFLAIERWSDGLYLELETEYAESLIKEYNITQDDILYYKNIPSYSDDFLENSLLETIEDTLKENRE